MYQVGLFLLGLMIVLVSLFLILLILVQRGRGGGISGALGGMGGQSAFGSKAGDLFTRITIVTAAIWIVLCMFIISFFNRPIPPGEFERTMGSTGEAETGAAPEVPPTTDGTNPDGTQTPAGDGAGQLPGEGPAGGQTPATGTSGEGTPATGTPATGTTPPSGGTTGEGTTGGNPPTTGGGQ